MKIPKKFKENFLIALRSGLFDQAQRQLRVFKEDKSIGFCCLGVACLVAKIPEHELVGKLYPSMLNHEAKNYDKLPKFFKEHSNIVDLAKMNDSGSSFEDIADYIEKNY
jgi:hypothetical protein